MENLSIPVGGYSGEHIMSIETVLDTFYSRAKVCPLSKQSTPESDSA